MIVQAILQGFYSIMTFILSLLPDLPQVSDEIKDGTDYLISLISNTVGLISYLFTPPILILVFTVLIAIINFEMIYKFAMWLIHKIRG